VKAGHCIRSLLINHVSGILLSVPATRRGRERRCPRTEGSSAAEGATGPRKRSGKRTAAGSGISGKPAGVPHACRTDEVRGVKRPESFRSRDRGGSVPSASIAGG